MTPHVHISLVSFLVSGAYLIIWGFLWRTLAIKWKDNAVGQAMGYIF